MSIILTELSFVDLPINVNYLFSNGTIVFVFIWIVRISHWIVIRLSCPSILSLSCKRENTYIPRWIKTKSHDRARKPVVPRTSSWNQLILKGNDYLPGEGGEEEELDAEDIMTEALPLLEVLLFVVVVLLAKLAV